MAKDYNPFMKSDSSLSSKCDEQKVLSKKETQKIGQENRRTSINDNLRQSSQNLLMKLYKLTFNSISLNSEEQKSNDTCSDISKEKENNPFRISKRILTPSISREISEESQDDLESTSNERPKLKGILKMTKKDSRNNQTDMKSNSTNNDDLISSDSGFDNSNSFKPIKHVTFNDKICKKRYKPSKSSSNETKLSYRQQKLLKKFQYKDSFNSHSINSSKFQDLGFCESSEYESSENED